MLIRACPWPPALYSDRRNSRGVDLGNPPEVEALRKELKTRRAAKPLAGPIVNGILLPGSTHPVTESGGSARPCGAASRDATPAEISAAFDAGAEAQPEWDLRGGEARAACLEKASELLEANRADFHELLVREAGKTISDAVAEVRETVDFCRYYALQARRQFATPQRLEGPTGELNELSLHGRGVFACISPWNFPLAIFAGQVTAALAAGNAVVAKPAEPTPLIAARFVKLLQGSRSAAARRASGAGSRTIVR